MSLQGNRTSTVVEGVFVHPNTVLRADELYKKEALGHQLKHQ